MIGTTYDAAPMRVAIDHRDFAFAGLSLLAIVAPFEATTPLLRVPGQSISDVEAALLVAFATWGLGVLAVRGVPEWRTPLTAPWTAFVAACAAASIASQISRLNALHMTGRFAAAFGVYLLTANAVTTRHRARLLLALVVASGAAVSVLALLEYAQVPAVLRLLHLFRPGLTTVGAQLRAGGPLQYPTIASMYLEIVFAFGVGLLLGEIDAQRRGSAALLCAAVLLVGEAITLTYTRAGLVTMAVTMAIAAIVRAGRRRRADAGLWTLAALAVAIAGLYVGSRSSDALWLRFTSEGQEAWYRAEIAAPPRVSIAAGGDRTIPIAITNSGRLVWDSDEYPPFYVSYHWMSPTGDRVVSFEGLRTRFAEPVNPGETVTLPVRVRAPRQAGEYRLAWDVVQEGRLWLSTEPGATAWSSRASVTGDASAGAPPTYAPPKPTVRPRRLQLWRAALAMFVAHPLLGVGPDNFRLSYGSYAGIATPDVRTHSNNMYLELLAGTGVVGAAAFAWLLWSVCRSGSTDLAIVCALAAIAVHGFVDSFLSFAPTYLLFALTLGLSTVDRRLSTTSIR